MAEEAFALSPISARAAQPSEEDYAAISEAFMETSRGRWFLGEYAKRNRNADTRMVLDAVARIEESLGAQRQAAADAAYDERRGEALSAVRGAIETVQASAIATLDGISFEQTLAPVRKGVRVIREISWRLREIGNDGRICDIIDSQASAIEAAAAGLSVDEAKAALDTAFAALAGRLAAFDPDHAAEAAAEAPAAEATAEVPVAEAHVAMTPEVEAQVKTPSETLLEVPLVEAAPPMAESPVIAHAPAAAVEDVAAATVSAPIAVAMPMVEAEAAPVDTAAEPSAAALAEAEAALAEAEAAEIARVADEAAAEAEDEAVLDLIAMEMGAPDPIDDSEIMLVEEPSFEEVLIDEADVVEAPLIVEPEVALLAPEPIAEPAPQLVAPAALNVFVAPAPEPEPTMEVSLGSTIIASGLVRKPSTAANDPLAPIRRMSQAEKIAFFS